MTGVPIFQQQRHALTSTEDTYAAFLDACSQVRAIGNMATNRKPVAYICLGRAHSVPVVEDITRKAV
jgi:hypothetical protein